MRSSTYICELHCHFFTIFIRICICIIIRIWRENLYEEIYGNCLFLSLLFRSSLILWLFVYINNNTKSDFRVTKNSWQIPTHTREYTNMYFFISFILFFHNNFFTVIGLSIYIFHFVCIPHRQRPHAMENWVLTYFFPSCVSIFFFFYNFDILFFISQVVDIWGRSEWDTEPDACSNIWSKKIFVCTTVVTYTYIWILICIHRYCMNARGALYYLNGSHFTPSHLQRHTCSHSSSIINQCKNDKTYIESALKKYK